MRSVVAPLKDMTDVLDRFVHLELAAISSYEIAIGRANCKKEPLLSIRDRHVEQLRRLANCTSRGRAESALAQHTTQGTSSVRCEESWLFQSLGSQEEELRALYEHWSLSAVVSIPMRRMFREATKAGYRHRAVLARLGSSPSSHASQAK